MRGLPSDESMCLEAYQGGNVKLIFMRVAFLKNCCRFATTLRICAPFDKQKLSIAECGFRIADWKNIRSLF